MNTMTETKLCPNCRKKLIQSKLQKERYVCKSCNEVFVQYITIHEDLSKWLMK
jgi:transposase-like protein